MNTCHELSIIFSTPRFDKLKYLSGKQEVEVDWHIRDLISGEPVGGVAS